MVTAKTRIASAFLVAMVAASGCAESDPSEEILGGDVGSDVSGLSDGSGLCGNGTCDDGESAASCPADCACGDGVCGTGEDLQSCPEDCTCGDGACNLADGEDASTCPEDCACGDGSCAPEDGESAVSCELDCFCGDGLCDGSETVADCAEDCACGDGLCADDEDFDSCPDDCRCGDGTCDSGEEDAVICPTDCPCGDASCDADGGEDQDTCPADCGGCGDGICDPEGGESSRTCEADCECGDSVCDAAEDNDACAVDCPCGDDVCDAAGGESFETCPVDCSCGDGTCDADGGESFESCPADCSCGDDTCDSDDGESFESCPVDCRCGDGACDSDGGEDSTTCPVDCPCGDGLCDLDEDACGCLLDCFCGNGSCDAGEDRASCPGDCDTCGDDLCGAGETVGSCAEDCDSCGDATCQPHEDGTSCAADCLDCVIGGEVPTGALSLPSDGVATGSTALQTNDHTSICASGAGSPDVVYTFDSPGHLDTLHASLAGSSYDTALHVYQHDCGNLLGCNDDFEGDLQSQLILSDLAAGTVNVVVDGFSTGNSGDYVLTVTGSLSAGQPCDPALTFLDCGEQLCAGECDGINRCLPPLDCVDGINADDDADLDEDACSDPPVVTCPDDLEVALFQEVSLLAMALEGSDPIVQERWSLRSAPPGSSVTVPAVDDGMVTFVADQPGDFVLRFRAVDQARQAIACEVVVTATILDCSDGLDNDGDLDVDEDDCVDGPVVGCSDPVSTFVGNPVSLDASVEATNGIFSQRWTVTTRPALSVAVPTPQEAASTLFAPDRPGTYLLRFQAIDLAGQASGCEIEVNAGGLDCADGIDADGDEDIDEDADSCVDPPVVTCPDDSSVPVLAPFDFSTSADLTNEQAGEFWRAIAAPVGSVVLPSSTGIDAWSVTPLLAGVYRFRYVVVDSLLQMSACEFELTATIEDDLRIELIWNVDSPEPDDPSDVDLHLLHPAAVTWVSDLDCYYSNCVSDSLDWGPGGVGDLDPTNDPRLDVDDVEGRGPENINIEIPELGGNYTIGVHYYDDDGFGQSDVLVSVFCNGSLQETFGPMTLDGSADSSDNDFWKVADLVFDEVGCTITPIDVVVTESTAAGAR